MSNLPKGTSFGVIDDRNLDTDENKNHPLSSFNDGII